MTAIPTKALEQHIGVNGQAGRRGSLAVDTVLPSPTGWTTVGAVRLGDWLFDDDGFPCQVEYAEEVQQSRPCFSVEFSDGTKVVTDADHRWLTENVHVRMADVNWKSKHIARDGREPFGRDVWQCTRRHFPSVVTTAEIKDTVIAKGYGGKRKNHTIPSCMPLLLPAAELLIDPYVLGCWLGDGTSSDASLTTEDSEIVHEMAIAGYQVGPQIKDWTRRGADIGVRLRKHSDGEAFRSKLSRAGLLNNKHIPAPYLRSSEGQRLSLLSGLMDTDGTVQKGSNSCIFYNTNKLLSDGAYELVCSLGWQARVTCRFGKLNGILHKECYAVRFRPTKNVFRLSRKADRLDLQRSQQARWINRTIVAVETVDSVPVRGIQVSSPGNLYLCGRSMIPTHNPSAGRAEVGHGQSEGGQGQVRAQDVLFPAGVMR